MSIITTIKDYIVYFFTGDSQYIDNDYNMVRVPDSPFGFVIALATLGFLLYIIINVIAYILTDSAI